MINRIFETVSPSGDEGNMISFLKEELKNYFDKFEVDSTGNLIAHKKGDGEKICIECGMDTKGIMIVSCGKDKVHFSGVGTVKAENLADKRIGMKNGAWGVARCEGDDVNSKKVTDLCLDIDESNVKIGDFGAVLDTFYENNEKMYANCISEKIGLAAVCEAVKNIKTTKDLYVLFSAQKRLGARGIRAFFSNKEFDRVITVDSCSCEGAVKAGGGCVIVIKDKKALSDEEIKNAAVIAAKDNNIKFQTAVCEDNLCIENIRLSNLGNRCLALGIPVEYKDKDLECAEKSDFKNAVKLLERMIG